MSKTWSELTSKERKIVAAAFDALNQLDGLASEFQSSPMTNVVQFRDLVGWVNGPPIGLPLNIKAALLATPSLRRDFEKLLERSARLKCDRASAASTGSLDVREGNGFRILLKPSKAAFEQIYVIVEIMTDLSSAPSTLVATDQTGKCARLALPEPQDGTAQVLVEENTDIVEMLRSPDSEVFLW